MIRLVLPSLKYKNSFLESLKENDEIPAYFPFKHREYKGEEFSAYIKKLKNFSNGLGLPKGIVPETLYWLVDTKNLEFIGLVTIRHRLNEFLKREGGHIGYFVRPSMRNKGYGTRMLKMALKKAKLLGLKNIILTCNKKNIPSKKIIEKNRGKFFSEIYVPANKAKKLRFRIEL
jgi:predicted acetyltransferase